MVVLNQQHSDNQKMYDLSFMYTKQCDLACPFCMYNSSPQVKDRLNLYDLRVWLDTVDYRRIASFGAYGGEVTVAYQGYSAIFDMLPSEQARFVITNGSWSRTVEDVHEFLQWAQLYRMHVVVSGTPEHRKYQNREVLEELARLAPTAFTLKPREENFIPMGGLAGKLKFTCSKKCLWWSRALRIAVQPDGSIIFQNCDGVYPVVGSIKEEFSTIDHRIQRMRQRNFQSVCPHA